MLQLLASGPDAQLKYLRFEFWKTVRQQIADPSQPIHIKQFSNETACIASEWHGNAGESLILLEAHH